MKRFFSVALLLFILLMGCTNTDGQKVSQSETENIEAISRQSSDTIVMYSNLTDENSKKEVSALLQKYGISKEQTDTLCAWADDFNSRVTEPVLPTGFVPMEGTAIDYRELIFEPKALGNDNYENEVNCRLTAYMLLKKHIKTNGITDESDTYLMLDINEIDTTEKHKMTDEERTNFISAYNWISVKGASTVEEHTALIQQAWQDREITVDGTTGLSLINLYLHSTFDDVRFVGHTGVLLDLGNTLLFVEKYGPEGPFQATKFKNRSQLKEFLLARPDAYGDAEELAPIAMENDKLLED